MSRASRASLAALLPDTTAAPLPLPGRELDAATPPPLPGGERDATAPPRLQAGEADAGAAGAVGAAQPAAADQVSVGYLRAFITLLVLAHHAILAYYPYAPAVPASLVTEPHMWTAFPVIDRARWAGFGLLVSFNDAFFMALMFFLSGLFVYQSLRRRGAAAFVRGRALRLGVPFVVAAAVVAPLAYYPAFLQTGGAGGIAGYARQWLALGNWPAGPAWFLWVLLAFDLLAALLLPRLPDRGAGLARLTAGSDRRPAVFFGLLVVAAAAAYLPLALTIGPFGWLAVGPFFVQSSRILLYAVYFLAGVAVGARGLDRGLLAGDGALPRRWVLWVSAAFVAFTLSIVVAVIALTPHSSMRLWGPLWGAAFILSGAASSFACLALFLRFARRRSRALDSLRNNAYGMYLLHYPVAAWLQLALLQSALPGLAKGVLVTLGTIAVSWSAVAALRRVPGVAKVI
jgi:peptidoglycan/LPS O-acetylase OafA/YrhL